MVDAKKLMRKNTWGPHPPNGGFAPERFPAFTIELMDLKYYEGPGNVSSTDYHLAASDGHESVEFVCEGRKDTVFEFRGLVYGARVHDNEGIDSYSVFPVTVAEQAAQLAWLPFELDGIRIDESADLFALVGRTLSGWTPPAARPDKGGRPERWALKHSSILAVTSRQYRG